jgi:hypothetical protein
MQTTLAALPADGTYEITGINVEDPDAGPLDDAVWWLWTEEYRARIDDVELLNHPIYAREVS